MAAEFSRAYAQHDSDVIELWLWEFTDEFGKRRRSRWRMTETDASRYRDAPKGEDSLERPRPLGGTHETLEIVKTPARRRRVYVITPR